MWLIFLLFTSLVFYFPCSVHSLEIETISELKQKIHSIEQHHLLSSEGESHRASHAEHPALKSHAESTNATTSQPPPLRRIINAFVFGYELETLEIRLNSLDKEVEVFILIEADHDFNGKPKPLWFNMSKHDLRFRRFLPRIHHVVVLGSQGDVCRVGWGQQNVQRAQYKEALRAVLADAEREGRPFTPDYDLFLDGDVDEIPNPEVLASLRTVGIPDGAKGAEMAMRRTFFNYVNQDGFSNQQSWISYIGSSPDDPQTRIKDAGWHCTWCFDIDMIQRKLDYWTCADGVRWGIWEWPSDTLRWMRLNGVWFGHYPRHKGSFQTSLEKLGSAFAPAYVLQHSDRFQFLLYPDPDPRIRAMTYVPGFCRRPVKPDLQKDEHSLLVRNLRAAWECQSLLQMENEQKKNEKK